MIPCWNEADISIIFGIESEYFLIDLALQSHHLLLTSGQQYYKTDMLYNIQLCELSTS